MVSTRRFVRTKLQSKLTIAFSVFLLWAVTACGSLPGSSSGGAPASILQAVQSPADVVKSFLDAWNTQNYQAMYALLSSQSQGLYTLAVFQTTYDDVAQKINPQGLTYNVNDTTMQGDTAVVHYDVAITSSSFGTIDDKGRTMRLSHTGAGWRVAWSSMDVFDGLASGAQIRVVAEHQPRANIYDHNGQPLVQENGTVWSIDIIRQNIPNESDCLDLLAHVLQRQREDLQTYFNLFNTDTRFNIGDLDEDTYNANSGSLNDTCAVIPYSRTTRAYYGHGAIAHLTGYIAQMTPEQQALYLPKGYDPGDLVGQTGIEAEYEQQLSGTPARVLRITEPGGMVLRELGGAEGTLPQPVELTIDRGLQVATSQAIADAYNYAESNWGNRIHSPGAAVVAIDVHTGAILAMSSYPMYDPNIFQPDSPVYNRGQFISELSADARKPFFDYATQDQYSPGSTFKIVTTIAAAAENVFNPSDTFYCDMQWNNGPQYGDTLPVRYDWRHWENIPEDRFATGDVTMSQALTSSCDPFFYEMGARLFTQKGHDVLSGYARRMGLGTSTGLYADEANGVIPSPSHVEDAINEAIGQGNVQVTPLQMARLVAAVANGGTVYQPYLVQQVGGLDGSSPSFQAQPHQVSTIGVSDAVLAITRQGMCDVTNANIVSPTTGHALGTAGFVFDDPRNGIPPAPYTVCGKTGTAQTGRTEPNAWFVAYAPADDPKIAIAAVTLNSREGSEVSGPIVRRILDYYFGAPVAPFPYWWAHLEYIPLQIDEGGTGG
jgi:penicillin-binding protein 2